MASFGLNIRIPKQSIIKLHELQHKAIVVKFNGGRQIYGQLKSWDKSMNLILNNTQEVIGVEGKDEVTRQLGLVIVKGSQIQSVGLREGFVVIDNPFLGGEGDGEEGEEEEEGEGEGEEGNNEKKQQPKKETQKKQEQDSKS